MLELRNVSKRYRLKKVLDNISLTLPETGMVGIVGPSGCGKTSLLHILGGVDHDFQGEMIYAGKPIKRCLHRYRRQHVSFIFQHLHLIMWLKAFDNCRLPHFFYKQVPITQQKEYSKRSIASLSLGQRQRLSYWRCFYHRKDILLCDEPTGSLDPHHADEIYEQLYALSKSRLVVVVSHDLSLVEKYCHEVYEMKDGCIGEHRILRKCEKISQEYLKEKHMLFPHIRLSFASLLSHKKQSIQLITGLTLSLLSILITLTLSRTLETEIQKYFYSLIPPSMISFKTNNHQNITMDIAGELMKRNDIERVQLFLNDYELLGVGFKADHYEESQTLMIGDDASPYQHLQLKKGRYPIANEEIMVSLSTAKHLAQSSSIDECIGKTLYAWYKHGLEVKSIAYHIVGITQNTTVVDTLYQQPNAYIGMLQNVYQDEFIAHFGVMYVDVDYSRDKTIEDLKTAYRDYDFMLSGEGTSQQISKVMKRVEIVLLVFSVLAILSSLFLIGEVMFLNVLQKKKDYAIMMCFGAKVKHLILLSICESLELLAAAWVVVVILYYQFLMMCEMFVKELFVGNVMKLSFDIELIGIVFIFSVGLIFLSQVLPMVYTLRMNTVEALK